MALGVAGWSTMLQLRKTTVLPRGEHSPAGGNQTRGESVNLLDVLGAPFVAGVLHRLGLKP